MAIDWARAGDGFSLLDQELVHDGYVWNVVRAEFATPDGSTMRRDIVRSPGAVAVLPVTVTDLGPVVTLVAQFRPPYERALLEIPAGTRDVAGEEPMATAQRELVEEAGLRAGSLRHLHTMVPSPGMTDSTCTIFLATDCVAVPNNLQGPEEASLVVVEMTLADAVRLVEHGTISDAKTAIALLLAARAMPASTGESD